jgi:hypothetical protein
MTAATAQNAQAQLDLVRYVDFRIRAAVGCVVAVVLLFVSTLGSWFSDNATAGSAPSTGLIDHWNFWLIISGGQGGGSARLPSGNPAGLSIGGREHDWGTLVLWATPDRTPTTPAEAWRWRSGSRSRS